MNRGDVITSKELWSDKIKKWILPGKGRSRILAVIGGKADRDVKVIYKKYGIGASQHVTLMVTDDGRVDIHLTEEGEEKRYASLFKGHIDLEALKGQAEALYRKSLRPIDVKDSFFLSFYILVPKSAQACMEFVLRSCKRGNKIVLPATKREEREMEDYLDEYFDVFPFKEVTDHPMVFGLCVNEKGDMGILMNDEKNYYFFSITEAINIFLNSVKPDL